MSLNLLPIVLSKVGHQFASQILLKTNLRALGVCVNNYSYRNMSDKPNTLLNAKDSWFNKYQITDAPEGVFKGVTDRFNGITIDSEMENCEKGEFEGMLQASLDHWISEGRRGIWFKVRHKDSDWVPALAAKEFDFHHAKAGFVMMCRWLPKDEPYNIPPYAHNMVGVGAVVVNDKNEVLTVSEKNALIKNSWKLPGGFLEPNENIVDAGIREVQEETGIETKFETVIAIRHAHGTNFGCSDLYIVVALNPVSSEITKCEREIAKCEWMPIDEYLQHPHVHETNRSFLRTYLDYKKNGVKIICREDVHQILKKKYNIYNAQLEKKSLNFFN